MPPSRACVIASPAIYTEGGAPIRPEGPAAVNRAVIMRDPDGYPLEFAFQGGPVAADVPASSSVIGGWATLIVGDVAATVDFYRDRLGFQPTGGPTTLSPAVLSLQGAPTATGSMSAGVKPPGAAATWRMYDFRNVERARLAGRLQDPGTPAVSFLAENVPALLVRLKAAGVTVDTDGGEAVNVDGRLRAFIRDPNGLLIELVEAGDATHRVHSRNHRSGCRPLEPGAAVAGRESCRAGLQSRPVLAQVAAQPLEHAAGHRDRDRSAERSHLVHQPGSGGQPG